MSMPSTPPYSLEFRREGVDCSEQAAGRFRSSRLTSGPRRSRITHLRTWEGWLYLVAVQDRLQPPDRRRSMADHMRTALVTDALQMALARRRPEPGLIWHSDQGSEFVSLAFGQQARAPASRSRWAHAVTASRTLSPRVSSPP